MTWWTGCLRGGARSPCTLRVVLVLVALQGMAPSPPSPAMAVSAQPDYHRFCTREGKCAHWEGLTCPEVDVILNNVRRYEKQVLHNVVAPGGVASSPISLAPSSVPAGAEAAADTRPRMALRGSHAGDGLVVQHPRHAPPLRDIPAPPQPQALVPAARSGSAGSPLARTAPSLTVDGQAYTNQPGLQDATRAASQPGAMPSQLALAKGAGGAVASGGKPDGKAAAACGKSNKVASFPVIDTDGHAKYRLGDGLEPSPAFPRGRYKILRSLGSGTYGKVVECWDRQAMAYCAVKIVRAVPKYKKAAELEVSVLLQLQGQNGCVRLLRHFEYNGHICMSFELLGPNLYEIMRACNFRPFEISHTRRVAAQVVESLCLVHARAIVHTDVKPENILLVDQVHKKGLVLQERGLPLQQLCVKLVDFGSAVHRSWKHPTVVSTRHYRAPEIIMQLGWSYPADMWSMGCILVELVTGEVLFGMGQSQSDNTLAHLATMHQLLGPFPREMIERARANGFEASIGPLIPPQPGVLEAFCRDEPLPFQIPGLSSKPPKPLHHMVQDRELCDLIRKLLHVDPSKRISAHDALLHPFFLA